MSVGSPAPIPLGADRMISEPFVIAPPPGFAPEVGRLVAMLEYARATTLQAVARLGTEQLDHRHDERSNSIAMLLAHIAAVESVYQVQTFESRAPTSEELERWEPALQLGAAAHARLRGRPLEDYVEALASTRARTLAALRAVDDAWLDHCDTLDDDRRMNRYWQWFHVCEDELSHRGQIRWLRARLPA